MKTIAETETEIIEEFSGFEDPMDRYEYLIDLGKELPELSEQFKQDGFLVKGCQSKVWIVPEKKEGRIFFRADSNTAITRGIVSLLLRVLSGRSPQEIQDAKLEFMETIQLRNHLSAQRSNGLSSMIALMKSYAAG